MTLEGMSRRTFLSTSALAVAAAGLAGYAGSNSVAYAAEENTAETSPLKEATSTVDCDIVVVGAGMAGFSAALTAVESGAQNVIMLETAPAVGGCSAFTEGIFGAGTSMQAELGEEGLDVQSLLKEVYNFHHYNVNPRLWELVANNSADNIQWLIDMGVVFDKVTSSGDALHTLHVHHEGFGMNTISVMEEVAKGYGIEILTETTATALLQEGGEVVGVQAESAAGDVINFNASKVILACGGIGTNFEYLGTLSDRNPNLISYVGVPGPHGFSIQAVSDITGDKPGPVTVCAIGLTVDQIGGSPLAAAFAMQPCNLWVNESGSRFVDEGNILYYSTAGNIVFNQRQVFAIFDQDLMDKYTKEGLVASLGEIVPAGVPFEDLPEQMEQANANGIACMSDTIEGLAEALDVDAANLQESLDRYNELCAGAADEDYSKSSEYMAPLLTPPYYAAQLKCGITNTCGGVRINENCQVVNVAGDAVKNLYATGVDCSGFQGETYCILLSGSEQATALATGRIAGAHAVQAM